MIKIGIVTITNSGMNFGNRLQNYALQKSLEREGVRVETIYAAHAISSSLLLSKMRRGIKQLIKHSKRRLYFRQFDKKYIHPSPIIRYGDINNHVFDPLYEGFITGSDQVWNPHFHFNSAFEFLTFANLNKRYSYAASFGVDALDPPTIKTYTKNLNDMCLLSVREYSGASLIEQLTGRIAKVHVDPCMLLTDEDYAKIEEKPTFELPENYILTYMLGHNLVTYQDYVDKLSHALGYQVIALSESKDSPYYHIGPQHFLYLLRHASYICTDSFHGTAFSILFNKNFTVFRREDNDAPMDARIETLLKKTELEERRFGRLEINRSIETIAYKAINDIISTERSNGIAYLNEIIETIKKNIESK